MSVVHPLRIELPCSSMREDRFFEFVARATDDELLLFLEQAFPLITAMESDRYNKRNGTIEVRESSLVEMKLRSRSSVRNHDCL
jgi:hypothetical protein